MASAVVGTRTPAMIAENTASLPPNLYFARLKPAAAASRVAAADPTTE